MYFVGVDIGSTMTKIVIINGEGHICSHLIGPTGPEHRRLANQVLVKALEQAALSFDQIDYVVATGYGRVNVPFADRQITELTCHARGVASLFPNVRIAIDIGGQDAKGLKIKDGKLLDFVMNDKCAAGTGRFLEVLAGTLGLQLEDLGRNSLESTHKAPISSTCTIFAQQEIIERFSEGETLANIVAGVHSALTGRVARMVQRLKLEPDIVLTGGVAKNTGIVKAMQEALKYDVLVPADPLLTGAIGAAILGKELFLGAMAEGKPIERKEHRFEEVTFFK